MFSKLVCLQTDAYIKKVMENCVEMASSSPISAPPFPNQLFLISQSMVNPESSSVAPIFNCVRGPA